MIFKLNCRAGNTSIATMKEIKKKRKKRVLPRRKRERERERALLIGIDSIELKDGAVHLVAHNSLGLDFIESKVHVDLDLDLYLKKTKG